MKNPNLKGLFFLLLISKLAATQPASSPTLSPEAREAFIQKAIQYRKIENFSGAVTQLDSILSFNKQDAQILLFKGDLLLQSTLFKQAVSTYKELLPLNYEPAIAKINLSYALFMNHQPSNALGYAKAAWQENKTHVGANVNHFNALLWNIKTKEAEYFLKQQQHLLSASQLLVLKARLQTTSGDYKNGLKYYDSLVKKYPDKYYVQEYAEVLLGKKEAPLADTTLRTYKNLFSAAEYKVLQEKIKAARLQNAGTEFVFFKDVAKNSRIENTVWWQQREGAVYRFRVSAGTAVITSILKEKTSSQFANLSITERWNKAWSGETDLRLQVIKPHNSKQATAVTGKQTIQYQPNDRRMIGAFISSDILNFTASLFEKNIRTTNAGYVTHLMMDGKTGFYSQGSAGVLTDKNQRFLFFGSLYRLLRTEPTLKTGLNFSALHYKDSTIKTYFSPNSYMSTEVFADYTTAIPHLSKFYLMLQAAAGMQKIEVKEWEPAFRFQSEVGVRLKAFEAALKYQTSNVASGAGTGYKFNWFTFRLVCKW